MNDSSKSPDKRQSFRQHWRCDACGEQGSLVGEEDVLKLIERSLHAHWAQNPDCGSPEQVRLCAPMPFFFFLRRRWLVQLNEFLKGDFDE